MHFFLRNPYSHRVALALVGDAMCLVAAVALAWPAAPEWLTPPVAIVGTAVAVVLTVGALYYGGGYQTTALGNRRRSVQAIIGSMGLAFAAAIAGYFLIQTPPGLVGMLASVAASYFPLLAAWRLGFPFVSGLPRFTDGILIVGASELGEAIGRAVASRPNLGMRIVGYLSDDPQLLEGAERVADYPVLGPVHEIEKILIDRPPGDSIGRIVVASKDRDEHFPANELLHAKLRGIRVESGIAFYEQVTGRVSLRDTRASYLIFAEGFKMGALGKAAKRTIDVSAALVGLILASPCLLLAMAAIKIEDRGPVFYMQERVGAGGKLFGLAKLRSMRVDAESKGARFTTRGDDRVTRVGRVIRKTRIDELPQLLNVLKGDMSLVGPRPERLEFVEELAGRYPYFRLRESVRPGVTGWAQVRYGYVNDFEGYEQKLALDLYYIKHRSVFMDLVIMWQTVKTVVLFQGV